VPAASPLLRDGTSDHIFERIRAAGLFQGPVVNTFTIARDGFDLGFETAVFFQGARVSSVYVFLVI